jgi:hypothetical protein
VDAKKIDHRVLLERAPWDSVDEAYCEQIPGDNPVSHTADLIAAVGRGDYSARQIHYDGHRVGLVIFTVDEGRMREFVIQAMYCDCEQPLCGPVGRQLEALARALGCASLRTHTVRHALARALAYLDGWRLTEVIMRKSLA